MPVIQQNDIVIKDKGMTRIHLYLCGLLFCVSITSSDGQTNNSTTPHNLQSNGRRSRLPPPSEEIEAQRKRDEYYRLHPERLNPLEKAEQARKDGALLEAIQLYELEKTHKLFFELSEIKTRGV